MRPERLVLSIVLCAGASWLPSPCARAQEVVVHTTSETRTVAAGRETLVDARSGESAASSAEEARLDAALRLRHELVPFHRALGISTWLSMTATAVLGWIRFADVYGFHESANGTACANGDAVMQDSCAGVPWPHLIAGIVTTSLYATTAGISFALPTPASSPDARVHGILRWIHMGLMLATLTLGALSANLDVDFSTRQALAATHMAAATSTLVVLSAAAALVLF